MKGNFDNTARDAACAQVAHVRTAYQGESILADGRTLGTDTWATGRNNNMLVLGPSGAGKTRHVLVPNLLQMGASFVVLDTKGTLHAEVGPVLAAHGYRVQNLNFANLSQGGTGAGTAGIGDAAGYNPLSHLRRSATERVPLTGNARPNQQDVLSVANALCPIEDTNQPFWDRAAANYLACLIAYVLEQLPTEEQTLASVIRLVECMGDNKTWKLLDDLEELDPGSYALALYRRAEATKDADRMHASILGILAEKLMCLGFDSATALYRNPNQVDFALLGHEPIALFVTVSDVDHSLTPLTNLFIIQAFQALTREADACEGGRLPHPVRLFLDDFSNLRIPDFTDLIAVVRSREIWCTLLAQTVSQLEERYGAAGAATIVGNCDVQLVLAFQDAQTARAYQVRANRSPAALMATPLDRSWLFVRGRPAEEVRRYDVTTHPFYQEMTEAQRTGSPFGFDVFEVPGNPSWDENDIAF